jgi:ketol-acid reductoisomerase
MADIQSGKFARDWMAEHRAGAPNLMKMRAAAAQHPIEKAGERVREMVGRDELAQGGGCV